MMTIEIESDVPAPVDTRSYVIWFLFLAGYLSPFDRLFTAVCRQRPTRKPCCGRETDGMPL